MLLVEILTLLNDHVTSGAGSPDTLTSYKIGSPSRIVIDLRFRRSIFGATI